METKKVGANETRWSETTALTVRRVVHASVLLDFGEAAGGAKILTDP